MANTLTIEEIKPILNYLFDTNKILEDQGKKTNAVSVTGLPGLGKTDLIRQIAKERGMTFVKLNLAQVEEVGD